MAQQAEASTALHFERNVVQCMNRLSESQKPGRVMLAEIGHSDQVVLVCDASLRSSQLGEPVKYVEKEQRMVRVTVN